MATQAIASPEELERFARELKQFNQQLQESSSRLSGQVTTQVIQPQYVVVCIL